MRPPVGSAALFLSAVTALVSTIQERVSRCHEAGITLTAGRMVMLAGADVPSGAGVVPQACVPGLHDGLCPVGDL